MYTSPTTQRFIVVPYRSPVTLLLVVCQYVEDGSTIPTDECLSQNRFIEHEFEHHTASDCEHLVNQVAGAHIQGVENMWPQSCETTDSLSTKLSWWICSACNEYNTPRSLLRPFVQDGKSFNSSRLQWITNPIFCIEYILLILSRTSLTSNRKKRWGTLQHYLIVTRFLS